MGNDAIEVLEEAKNLLSKMDKLTDDEKEVIEDYLGEWITYDQATSKLEWVQNDL